MNNFWTECPELSDGCEFSSLFETTEIKYISDETINKSKKLAGRKNIFTCSYSDFFISDSYESWDDTWKVIRAILQHIWIIITNRYNIKQQGYPRVVLEKEKSFNETNNI